MADRYQDRPFPADGFGRGGDPHAAARAESDPLAELARLIGQTDVPGRAGAQSAPRAMPPRQAAPVEPVETPQPGPPTWMQRANRQEVPRNQQREAPPVATRDMLGNLPPQRPAPAQGFPGDDHDNTPEQDFRDEGFPEQDFESQEAARQEPPRQSFPNQEFADELAKLDYGVTEPRQRFAAQPAPNARGEPAFDEHEPDQSRYDDALFGQLGPATQDYQDEQDYQEDQFGYQDGYDEAEEEEAPKRRSGIMTVVALIAFAFIGTGASAFVYKSYFSSSRSGEPPIIKADNSPTKIMASPADSTPKVPDRLLGGDGSEKLVSREETPVDLSRSVGPRVVFPQLNQNGNPPSPSSVSTGNMPPAQSASNGTMPNSDPRPIKTFSVGGNPADGGNAPAAAPVAAKPAAAAKAARNANASANAPLALTPQAAPPAQAPARIAAAVPVEAAPASAPASGGYLVSISSQASEAEAITSYQAVQGKYASVLGSYTPVIKRVDVAGVPKYRAAVGPFASKEEANRMCGTLKTAGGQCFPFSNQ
jgi:hypothetical protein